MQYRTWIKIIFIFLLLTGCQDERLNIDVSGIDVKVNIRRFEQDLFSPPVDSIPDIHPKLLNQYGGFYKRFIENIIGLGNVNDPAIGLSLKHFVSDNDIQQIYDDCSEAFDSKKINTIEKQLTSAFKHYRYYFPKKKIPEVLTFISAFNYAIVATDSALGISLDMYLGRDYKFYPMMRYPLYKIRNMTANHIVPDAMEGWLITEFENKEEKQHLLSKMIYNGKILYLLDAMLPDTPDSLKIGYTSEQTDWCRNNEFNMWAHFVDNELLYSTDHNDMAKYLSEGPFTKGFPEGSPARTGTWVGWQIVRAFMENHPKVSLQKLMKIKAQAILNQSKYKPDK